MSCAKNVAVCVSLGSMFVGSLYVWRNTLGRDHPSTIKKRFISVFCITLVSALIVYLCGDVTHFKNCSYWSLMGLRMKGIFLAAILPLILTMVLFSGPLFLQYLDRFYSKNLDIDPWKSYTDIEQWKLYILDVMWLRNYIVAPFSEEFTFRACMLPILVPCFGSRASIFICPFFFGIAHLHHLKERLVQGVKFQTAVLQSLFQFAYTTVFGAYSSYLFLRTGHFTASLIAHAFCNYMGFPNFGLLMKYEQPVRMLLTLVFAAGLVCWMLLLEPMTDPLLFENEIYW